MQSEAFSESVYVLHMEFDFIKLLIVFYSGSQVHLSDTLPAISRLSLFPEELSKHHFLRYFASIILLLENHFVDSLYLKDLH